VVRVWAWGWRISQVVACLAGSVIVLGFDYPYERGQRERPWKYVVRRRRDRWCGSKPQAPGDFSGPVSWLIESVRALRLSMLPTLRQYYISHHGSKSLFIS
jgi:hypothetical protein